MKASKEIVQMMKNDIVNLEKLSKRGNPGVYTDAYKDGVNAAVRFIKMSVTSAEILIQIEEL